MKVIIRILPHITIILSALFITFLILDQFNPMMNFVDNDISQVMLYVLCASAMANAILLVAKDRGRL